MTIKLTEKSYPNAVQEFIDQVVKNSYHCAHCKYKENNTCSLAYYCLTHDFREWDEKVYEEGLDWDEEEGK